MLKSSQNSSVDSFPTGFVIIALAMSACVFIFVGWHAVETGRDLKLSWNKAQVLERTRSEIVYLDEALTMSALMAAKTGELKWIQRHLSLAPRLEKAISEAIRVSGDAATRAAIRETERANDALIDMETESFDFVRRGELNSAWSIVSGDEYEGQKRIYAAGMNKVINILDRNGETLNAAMNKRLIFLAVAVAVAVIPTIIAWAIALRRIGVWRAAFRQSVLERDRAEERRQIALISAQQANRAKSDFLASMSHELRTPLNSIIGFSEMIGTEVYGSFGDEKYKEYLSHIQTSGYLLLHLVNDVLDLSKIEAGRFELHEEEFELCETLQSCLDIVRGRQESRSVTFQFHGPDQPVRILADERAVKQIVLNLLSNGVKYNVEGGTVTLAVSSEPDNSVTIRVSDTGIGIAPENLAKVLQPFGQVREDAYKTHEGTGLGLSLSKQLTELHGGTLTIESQVQKGTTVFVKLPSERSK